MQILLLKALTAYHAKLFAVAMSKVLAAVSCKVLAHAMSRVLAAAIVAELDPATRKQIETAAFSAKVSAMSIQLVHASNDIGAPNRLGDQLQVHCVCRQPYTTKHCHLYTILLIEQDSPSTAIPVLERECKHLWTELWTELLQVAIAYRAPSNIGLSAIEYV